MARFEVKFAAVEVDGGGEVIEVAEASGGGLHPLDFGVQAFADRVRDAVLGVGQHVVQTTFEHLRFFDHRFQAAVCRPEVPLLEMLASPRFGLVLPQRQGLFLDRGNDADRRV